MMVATAFSIFLPSRWQNERDAKAVNMRARACVSARRDTATTQAEYCSGVAMVARVSARLGSVLWPVDVITDGRSNDRNVDVNEHKVRLFLRHSADTLVQVITKHTDT